MCHTVNSKSKQYVLLNKNILVAITASIIISAIAAQLLADQEDYLNTTYTLIVDYVVYFGVFSILFYFDNRHKYRQNSDNVYLRQDLIKIITSLGIGEIIYTISRWFFQYYFLTIQYDPYLASIIGHVISAALYLIVINLSVKITRLFKDDN